jgi:hypothetical protein
MRSMRAFSSKLGAVLLLGGVVALAGGCIKKGKTGVTQAEMEALKDHILDALPEGVPHKLDVNFDDKIHLVGWKAEPENAAPGTHINFTLYWKKTGKLDAGWELFTHITGDDTSNAMGNLDCVGAIRSDKNGACTAQVFGPSEWQEGKIIVDTFDYTVPNETDPAKKLNTQNIRFLVGVWKAPDARLQIKTAEFSDGQNRSNAIMLPTGIKPTTPPKTGALVPRLTAPKLATGEALTLDGKLDEPFWNKAGNTGPFVSPGDGQAQPDHPVAAVARIAYDDKNLYVAFVVNDKDPTSPFKATDKDPRIWTKSSAVELMIQPGKFEDNRDYYELQVDTNGAVFDSHWDDYNKPITGDDEATKIFGHMDWSSGLKSATVVEKGTRYTMELAIPWASFVSPRVAAPPKNGDSWRIQLYTFRDGQRQALAWSPILDPASNFHRSSRFGIVTFSDGTPVPAASGSAVATPAPGAFRTAPGVHIMRPRMQVPPTPE